MKSASRTKVVFARSTLKMGDYNDMTCMGNRDCGMIDSSDQPPMNLFILKNSGHYALSGPFRPFFSFLPVGDFFEVFNLIFYGNQLAAHIA